MAKARKTVRPSARGGRKSGPARSKTAAGRKKVATGRPAAGRKKAATSGRKSAASSARPGTRPPRPLKLNALKKQIRVHVDKLSSATSLDTDPRVAQALASLQRVYSELSDACGTTMTLPLA